MLTKYTYLRLILIAAACLLTGGLYAAEEGLEEDTAASEEGMPADEGEMKDTGTAAAEEGMEEGMLEEEGEQLPPLYTSEIEVGVLYDSQDSAMFGQFSGLDEEGFYAIGNIDIRKNSIIGDGDDNYWRLYGTNLGLDSRYVYGEFSHDGTYGEYSKDHPYSAFFFYDQLPRNQLDDAYTPFVGTGTNFLSLPAAYNNTGNGTAGISFNGTLHQVDVETERQTMGGGISYAPADGWKITAKYQHQDKDGTDTTGISTAGFTNAFEAIMPINFNFDEFDLKLNHVGKKGYFDLGYHLSIFHNDNKDVVYENPFNNSNPNPLRSLGAMGQYPDNRAHSVSFAGGYRLGQTTLATANLSYQRMSQDQHFLPFTNNTLVALVAPLPRNSLNGAIDNYFANLTLTGRPLSKLGLTARYTFDYRDSDTPHATYQYVRTDRDNSQALTGSRSRVNKVYDYQRQRAELDASYQLIPRATLQGGYTFEYVNRSETEVDDTYEHTGSLKLLGSPSDWSHAWVRYLRSYKHGSSYDNTVPFFYGFSPEHVNDVAVNDCGDPANGPYDLGCVDYYENSGFMRKYYLADRKRDLVAGNFSVFPNNKFTVGITGSYTKDDYDETLIGLKNRNIASATLDLSYMPNENLTTYAYYTYDWINNNQMGCEGCSPLGPLPQNRVWNVTNTDHVNTIGTGFQWTNVIENKLDLNLDFVFTKALTEVDPQVATNFVDPNILPFPDITTTIYHLNLSGDYRLNQQTRIRMSYLYEYFSNKDWAFDNVEPTTIDIILGTGERSPDYNVNVVGVSVIYDF